jgi:hypothetical protein
LYLTGTPFSVSAAVGFISIFGIAVMDGILLSFYIRQLWQEGHPFREAINHGLRPEAPRHDDDRHGRRVRIAAGCGILQPVLIYLCHRRLRLEDTQPPIARHVAQDPAASGV